MEMDVLETGVLPDKNGEPLTLENIGCLSMKS